MSHRRRGRSQSSSDILVEETVIDTTEESDSSETLVDQTGRLISYFIQVSYLTTVKLVKHQCEKVKVEKLTMKKK